MHALILERDAELVLRRALSEHDDSLQGFDARHDTCAFALCPLACRPCQLPPAEGRVDYLTIPILHSESLGTRYRQLVVRRGTNPRQGTSTIGS
jgi:hypothetical protein